MDRRTFLKAVVAVPLFARGDQARRSVTVPADDSEYGWHRYEVTVSLVTDGD